MPSRDYPAPSQEKTTPESVETKRENIQDRLFRMLDELNAEFTANGLEKDKETLTEIKKEISRLPKEFKDKHGQLNEIVKEFENREATFDEVYNGYRPSTPQIRSQIFNKYRYDKGQQKYLTDSRQVLVSLRTSDPNNSVYIGRLKNLGSYGNSEVGLKTALQTRAIEPANHGLSPQAEKIFLAKFGLIPNTGDEEWYRELFRKGETQPEDKVLGWYSGNHKTSVPGVSLVLWKFRQRKSEWGLENLPDANKPLNVSAILMSLDKKLIEEMVKTENQTAAQNVTGTPAVESADLLDF